MQDKDFQIDDEVIVFSDYGSKYSLSKVTALDFHRITLESGDIINTYLSDSIAIFKYDKDLMEQALSQYKLKKIIYTLHYNAKARAKIDLSLINQLEEIICAAEVDGTVQSGLTMGSIDSESSFILGFYKNQAA